MTVRTGGDGGCPSIDIVQRAVAQQFNVRVIDLKSCRRDRITAHARHAAMALCRELTPFSLPVIGRHFGKRDHTTVMYACHQVERRRKESAEVDRALTRLAAEISGDLDEQLETMMAGPQERAQALEELAPLLSRREVLLAELELVDSRIDEIGQSTFGAALPAEAEE